MPVDYDPSPEWTHYMRRGDFEAAWRVSDRVLRDRRGVVDPKVPRHLQSIWNGAPIDDARVLVRCYHGLGDTIQFVRYCEWLRARARDVTVWAQPGLIPVLATARGIDRLLPLHDGDPGVTYDVDMEIMELPYVFRTTLCTIPSRVPYLWPEPARLPRNQRPNVGLVWRAGDWATHRSIGFHQLEPVTSAAVNWYVLQGGDGLSERPASFGVIRGTDLVDAARVIRALDLLITIDSMPAHLGGALGMPVWTLLAVDADWRWMINRDATPWYPTMRLFRQTLAGDWRPVVDRVAAALHSFVTSYGRGAGLSGPT